jgi:phosphatidylglycerol:prolipoprotein diacylglycerol transferase
LRPYVLRWLESFLPEAVANALAPTWFTCVGLAGVLALIAILAIARRRGLDQDAVASAVTWGYVAAVICGIALPMLFAGVEHLLATGRFQLRWSGMTSYCGYAGGAAAVVITCRRKRIPLRELADAAVAPLGLSLVLARIGCFMAGCDYGDVTSLPWGVSFPAGSPAWRDHLHAGLISSQAAESLPVHPTELYEASIGLVLVVLAIRGARRVHPPGNLFLGAAATYAIARFFVETLRGDAGRGVYAGISFGQLWALAVLVAIGAYVVLVRRRLTAPGVRVGAAPVRVAR